MCDNSQSNESNFLIVGLGASAGGIKALKEFFQQVSADSGIAYVVILHLSPEHESLLAEVLQQSAAIPVTQVRDEQVKVVPNHVYVIPPNKSLKMNDGHLALSDVTRIEERRAPIDIFFRTLAESHEACAAAVILSGTGADGSMGMKRVKEKGGVVFVQDPLEAEFGDMPRNSIATGFLFLGTSESADNANEIFAAVDKEHHIYQSRNARVRVSLPIPELTIRRADLQPTRAVETGRSDEANALERLASAALHQRLLEGFAPPSIVVNENYDILHLSPQAGKYLEVAGGEPSYNLLKIIRPELRLELRAALYQAVQNRVSVETRGLRVNVGEQTQAVNLVVRPILRDGGDTARGFLLVLFEESKDAADGEIGTAAQLISLDEPARHLEAENEQLRNHLRETVDQYETQTEELRASNEELQAMNEELRSATEELETGKEELQSVNEELTTVNQELKIKIEELSQSNNDFQNLMSSTDIGTLFLDRNLRVKLFTPRSLDIFNLRPSDIGRPLSDITTKLVDSDLHAEAGRVLARLQSVEREVTTGEGRVYLTNILPYRTTDDRIDGVIATFVEITERKKHEQELGKIAEHLERQTRIFDTTLSSISDFAYLFDRDGRFVFANQPLFDLLGITAEEIKGKNFFDLNYPEDLAARLQKQIQKVFDAGEIIRDEMPFTNPATGERYFYEYIFTPVFAKGGAVELVAGSTRDVTERKQTEETLRHSEESLRLAASAARMYLWELDLRTQTISVSEDFPQVVGFAFDFSEQNVTEMYRSLFHPDDFEKIAEYLERAVAGTDAAPLEARLVNPENGEIVWIEATNYTVLDNDGKPVKFVGVAQNITERKQALEALPRSRQELENRVRTRTAELARANESLRQEVVERKQLEDERVLLLKQIVDTQEDERQRIARDLHDHLGQQLTALRLKLESIREMCDEEKMCGRIDETQAVARKIDSDVDFLAWELRPSALSDFGIVAAISNYVTEWSAQFNVRAEFNADRFGKKRLSPEAETNLYRIAQEALNNIAKHARAKRVDVLLEHRDGFAVLIIEDDGIGFKPDKLVVTSDSPRGLGLVGMRERAALVGGTLEIETAPNGGATIYARVPVSNGKEGKAKNV